jgi:hypothetical protein
LFFNIEPCFLRIRELEVKNIVWWRHDWFVGGGGAGGVETNGWEGRTDKQQAIIVSVLGRGSEFFFSALVIVKSYFNPKFFYVYIYIIREYIPSNKRH